MPDNQRRSPVKKVERARIVIVPCFFQFHFGTKNNNHVP
ncbi:hypothetical protein BN4901_2772 [Citrobacter europaeus]|uniref:Uncharacterized protein n=1 Tax=Citrobacter europaeus TaxID=1914243 RepID=A0ABY0JQH4_9ENTR|nr:hypothetical protein CIP106467_1664 [Citrobacter europaeus]SBW25849.1 hypothetical protein BN4901_2772 [Citrobacter europaeus]